MALVRISYLSMYRPVSDALAALSEGFLNVSAASPASGGAPVAAEAPPEEPSTVKEEPAEFQAPENPAPKPAPAPEPAPESEAMDAAALLGRIIDSISDPLLTSKLALASPELNDGSLTLTFKSKDAEICAEPLKKCLDMISKTASDVRRAPTTIEIKVKASRTKHKKSIKEKAMSEPLVKEALELFEGRVIDVREVKDN